MSMALVDPLVSLLLCTMLLVPQLVRYVVDNQAICLKHQSQSLTHTYPQSQAATDVKLWALDRMSFKVRQSFPVPISVPVLT